jgi:hypothetical protein
MKYEYLSLCNELQISERDFWVEAEHHTTLNQEAAFSIGREEAKHDQHSPHILKLIKKAAGSGLWVPYITQKNVFGYVSTYHFWAASGPFSGCVFEVGEKDGRKYVAHLSRESKVDLNIEAWNEVKGRRVLFTKKIDILHQDAGATIVFANFHPLTVTRVDIATKDAGGMTGQILKVEKLRTD